MNDGGDVSYRHRRGGGSKVIARNMAGKPFHIRVRDNGHDFKEEKPAAAGQEADPVDEEKSLRIPERDGTNRKGVTVRAAGFFEPGTDHVTLRIGGEWVIYPIDSLTDKDRKELLIALDFIE